MSETTQQTPVLLSSREVGQLLGVAQKTIERLSHKGQFPKAVKIGRLCKWSKAAVMSWIESQAQNGK